MIAIKTRMRCVSVSLQPVCLFLLLLLPSLAAAGAIRIEPGVTPDLAGPVPAVELELTNRGDEPARAVRASVRVGEAEAQGRPIRELAPGQAVRERLVLPRDPAVPGLHHAVLRIAYTDLNGAPFSAVSLHELPLGEAPESLFAVPDLEVTPFARSGRLTLRITPLEETPLDLTVSLVLPDEIVADEPVRSLRLEPDRPAVVTFALRNEGARAGSRYAVFAVLDHAAGGVHRSVAADGEVAVGPAAWDGPWSVVAWFGLAAAFAVAWLLSRRGGGKGRVSGVRRSLGEGGTLTPFFSLLFPLVAALFILWHLSPGDLLRDTTVVGGDTPAHNYLASHLAAQLFGQGRLVSWADGWWGGFPMFQFYFPLPYALMALLGVVLPFNVAVKVVSVAGAVLLPFAAFAMGRLMRLARPGPEVLALLMVPFLFVDTHVMWGVNLASTLAGMIANSLSFALMLLALGSAWRDAADGRFRLRTVALLALVMASHFFTSVMTALVLLVYPALQRRGGRGRALLVLAGEGALAILLMAWWLVPLIATSAYSMEFGTNWPLAFWKTFPPYTAVLAAFGFLAVAASLIPYAASRLPPLHPPPSTFHRPPSTVFPFLWMFFAALILFLYGFFLSPVFVNVRLWPFLFFAIVVLGGIGIAGCVLRLRGGNLALLALAAGLLGGVTWQEQIPGAVGGTIRAWAEWNFGGLEGKPAWPVFRDLVLPLKGTPGRLANDLSEDNSRFGSSRVFEAVPHLIGKPVLEGGLVNSAAGALFAYYIQSETSESCAGHPPMMVPAGFNLTNATRHLELFNVKHFIARWPGARQALAQSPDWRRLAEVDGWEAYELLTHQGGLVHVMETDPVALETKDWKQDALAWFAESGALSLPVVLVPPGGAFPPGIPRITPSEFKTRLRPPMELGTPNQEPPTKNQEPKTKNQEPRTPNPEPSTLHLPPSTPSPPQPRTTNQEPRTKNHEPRTKNPLLPLTPVRWESATDGRIVFVTAAVGRPHLIKMNWFPNWQVRGADAVYRVTPAFMLVIPRQSRVELYYGRTNADRLGLTLTALGWGIVGVVSLGIGASGFVGGFRDEGEERGSEKGSGKSFG